jgi:hypothetical protein
MRFSPLIACAVAAFALNVSAQVPRYLGRYEASTNDYESIMQVTTDFRSALTSKDTTKLEGLLVSSSILFTSPRAPDSVRKARAQGDTRANGISGSGALDFLQFVATSKGAIEERFYNIRITQDKHVAWVMFDFEFLENGIVTNYGIETWQMIKTADESWKIMSVVWTSHGSPK